MCRDDKSNVRRLGGLKDLRNKSLKKAVSKALSNVWCDIKNDLLREKIQPQKGVVGCAIINFLCYLMIVCTFDILTP